jgi:hypothetical protein
MLRNELVSQSMGKFSTEEKFLKLWRNITRNAEDERLKNSH